MDWLKQILTQNPFAAGSFIVAFISAVYLVWWRQRKNLRYQVMSEESIAGISKEYNDQVKIFLIISPLIRCT